MELCLRNKHQASSSSFLSSCLCFGNGGGEFCLTSWSKIWLWSCNNTIYITFILIKLFHEPYGRRRVFLEEIMPIRIDRIFFFICNKLLSSAQFSFLYQMFHLPTKYFSLFWNNIVFFNMASQFYFNCESYALWKGQVKFYRNIFILPRNLTLLLCTCST